MTNTQSPQPTRRLIDSAELRAMLPVARTTFYKTIRRDGFPDAIQLIDGGDYFWYLDEVEDFIERQRRRPGRDRTAPRLAEDDEAPVLRPGRGRRPRHPDSDDASPTEVSFRARAERRSAR